MNEYTGDRCQGHGRDNKKEVISFRRGLASPLKKVPLVSIYIINIIENSIQFCTASVKRKKGKMLSRSNDSSLSEKGVNKKALFFYHLWQELVNEKTLDIYQYKIHTSLSILKEFIEVLREYKLGFIGGGNIDDCREESLYIISRDPIMEKYYKSVYYRLKDVLGKKHKEDNDKIQLMYRLTYIVKDMEESYLANNLKELKLCIEADNLSETEIITNNVVSYIISKGWSPKSLTGVLRHFVEEETDWEYQWKNFEKDVLNEHKSRHDVLINIPFREKSESEIRDVLTIIEKLNLKVKTYDELVSQYNAKITDINERLKHEKRYIQVEVEAFDVYTAAHLAIKKIAEMLNLASFYNLLSAWDLTSASIVSINMDNTYHKEFLAKDLYGTYDYLDSSNKIFGFTNQIFLDPDRKDIREKLQGAFSYTNISRASLFQEEKFMNLWVALESLARTEMHANIIFNIKETVPAALSLRYLYRVVRNYVEDCIRCSVSYDFTTCKVDLKQDTKQKLVREVIEIFNDEGLYSQLLEKCNVNVLLKYRTECVHKMITDISYAKEKVENYNKRIRWQIQRLYRIRNEIAHTALQDSASLIVYIEDLYEYLSIYISEIVTYICEKDQRNIEEALCSINDSYEIFIYFAEKEESLLKETVLKTGIIAVLSDGFNS